ncbi:DUF2927 domain-containing protein [Coralliovum pocilloporae]|uniref:DUF2927 domain-containing protein n=1 Tax=Coralliovum pocilloporae TaxID=3066369 RepID=UPI003307A6C8
MLPRTRLMLLRRILCGWFLACVLFPSPLQAADRYSDAVLQDAFLKTVFDVEYSDGFLSWFGGVNAHVKKYIVPVRFHIMNLSRTNRLGTAQHFVLSLNSSIRGIAVQLVGRAELANFRVFIVDREQYVAVARHEIFRDPTALVPGKCMVQVDSDGLGRITASTAVIVADEGEYLFRRCLIEEVLQGLGPLNDHDDLADSIFNDYSSHSRFTRLDRFILNMLYDPRIQPGMRAEETLSFLPFIIRDARRTIQAQSR